MNRSRPIDLCRHNLPYIVKDIFAYLNAIKRHEVNDDVINKSIYLSKTNLLLTKDY